MTEKKKSRLKIYVSILLVIVGYVGFLKYYEYYRRKPEIERIGISQFMQQKAKEAIKSAQEEYQIELDGSPESIESVEKILAQLYERHQQKPIDGILIRESHKWGAYVGEMIKTQKDGEWQYDPKTAAITLQLVENQKTLDFMPTRWCYQRITRGDLKDNIWYNFLLVTVDPAPSQHGNLETRE